MQMSVKMYKNIPSEANYSGQLNWRRETEETSLILHEEGNMFLLRSKSLFCKLIIS